MYVHVTVHVYTLYMCHVHFLGLVWCVFACECLECVCVCAREREREREGAVVEWLSSYTVTGRSAVRSLTGP